MVTQAHATKTNAKSVTTPKKTASKPASQERTHESVVNGATSRPAAVCACGGGCPRCNSRQQILQTEKSEPNLSLSRALSRAHGQDSHEREAHELGARIIRFPRMRSATQDKSTLFNSSIRSEAIPTTRTDPGGLPPARAPPALSPSAHRRAFVRHTTPPDSRLGAGRGLTKIERDQFEPAFGIDFSAVRIHDGPPAEVIAESQRAHAFAYGSHIVLGRSVQRASSVAREQIFAHELVHVMQQAHPFAANDPQFDGHRQTRAPPAAEHVLTLSAAPLGIQRFAEDDESIIPQWASNAASAVTEFGEGAWETATELPGRAVDFVLESAVAVVDRLAPGLLSFLRGGALGQLTDLFCSGVDTLLGGLFATLGEIDFISTIETNFTGLAEGVRGVQSAIGGAASSVLGTLLRPLVEGLEVWGSPLIDTIQSISGTINGLFTGVWEHLAIPALDFLSSVGGGIMDTFTSLVGWVWDITAPIRNTAETAWNWLLETFDLAWNSTSGVRKWLGEMASSAWDVFLETIEPIREPLTAAGGSLLLISPLGPIIILTQVVPPLWEKITWLWNNWNTEDILVRAHDALREDILPGVLGTVTGVASALSSAAVWLAEVVGGFGSAMQGVLGAFGASRCLTAVTAYLNGIADQFARLALWAQSGFSGLQEALQAAFDALVAIFRPILDFLVLLFIVVSNPPMIPIALTAAVWLLCPADLKPPVIAFVLDLLIAFIVGFPVFLTGLGPLASVIKAGVLGFLKHLRGNEEIVDQQRVDASNKIANLAAGGGLEFIAGLAIGLLHGLIDGIIDPFRLIFMIGRVIVLAAQALGRILVPFVLESAPGLALGLEDSRGAMALPVSPARSVESTLPEARAPPSAARESSAPTTTGTIIASGANAAELPRPAHGDRTDAEIAAAVSPGLAAELVASSAETAIDENILETDMRSEVESEGATVGGLARILGDAWAWIIAGAEGLGARAASALLKFIMLPDFQLGRKLGFVAGFVLLELLIAYFTAGGYTIVEATSPLWRQLLALLLRFLDLGGELLAILGQALRPLRSTLISGLGAARGFLNRFRFARNLIDRVERLAGALFRFGDEVAEVGARGAREGIEESSERVAREAVETTRERAGRETAEEIGEGGYRAVDEPGVRTIRDDKLKAAQFADAIFEARLIAEANDRLNTPIPGVLGALMLLKRRYHWIDTFTARSRVPQHYRIELIASPGVPVDPDYFLETEILSEPGQVPISPALLDSAGIAREVGVPEELLGDSTAFTRLDFEDVIADVPPGIGRPAPPRLSPNRPVGRSAAQNIDVQADQLLLEEAGATNIRVNQTQTDIFEQFRIGTNRPDVQATLNGHRVHIEYDRAPGTRAIEHARRILSNDPNAIVILKIVDFDRRRRIRRRT